MRWHRLVVLLAVSGCAGSPSCPLVGAVSELTVQLPVGTTQARACVAGVCSSTVVADVVSVPLGRRGDTDTAEVTVTLPGTAATYEGVVPILRGRPNGPGCPPLGVTGKAVVDVQRGRVVPG